MAILPITMIFPIRSILSICTILPARTIPPARTILLARTILPAHTILSACTIPPFAVMPKGFERAINSLLSGSIPAILLYFAQHKDSKILEFCRRSNVHSSSLVV